jgi:hypothetical protein
MLRVAATNTRTRTSVFEPLAAVPPESEVPRFGTVDGVVGETESVGEIVVVV